MQGISHYPTGLTGRGQTSSGRLQVLLLSRTPCFSSLTVWTGFFLSSCTRFLLSDTLLYHSLFCFSFFCCPGLEELDSVALQKLTEASCSASIFFSYHVKNDIENITRSPFSVFGVCHMDDWLAHPTCGRVLMRGKVHHLSLYIPPISRQ